MKMTVNGFTISDIHAIRNENYQKTKNLSNEELICMTKKQAAVGWRRIERLREVNAELKK